MIKRIFIILMTAALFSALAYAQPAKIRVLVVTGGHDYNQSSFTALFESMSGTISYHMVPFPEAFSMFTSQKRNEFDVVVFYHMWPTITDDQKNEMIDCFWHGKPLVVLHHSLCAFNNWDEYSHITGGRYFTDTTVVDGRIFPPSTYKHNVYIPIKVSDSNNPVTRGIADFELFDEVYGGFWVERGVTSLLTTDHPDSSPMIGWSHYYGKSRVVVIQPGHDTPAYESPVYRRLLLQAIEWVFRGK